MDYRIDPSFVVSLFGVCCAFVAICISLLSIFLQYSVRGARIELLNANDHQRKVPRYHRDLPKRIQEQFPDYPDAAPGYAFVSLVFGNSGDRTGIANIQGIKIRIKDNPNEIIRASHSKYVLVPAYEILETEIVLKNIQIGTPLELEIELSIEYGSYHPRTSKYLHKGVIQKTLLVSLVRADEDPWYFIETEPSPFSD